ncbi:uncharacterized protein G2W53_040933 [Senna tora]|uniref:Uncharacterized protein n=1 Tax=Senna tora TaxID=362788 RepID=A0A834SEC5_9FABA|nr:uncharacterized protein G2W53_040933 [Senna tora]
MVYARSIRVIRLADLRRTCEITKGESEARKVAGCCPMQVEGLRLSPVSHAGRDILRKCVKDCQKQLEGTCLVPLSECEVWFMSIVVDFVLSLCFGVKHDQQNVSLLLKIVKALSLGILNLSWKEHLG